MQQGSSINCLNRAIMLAMGRKVGLLYVQGVITSNTKYEIARKLQLERGMQWSLSLISAFPFSRYYSINHKYKPTVKLNVTNIFEASLISVSFSIEHKFPNCSP